MPAITFGDFSGGLDRRLPITVQESNRLWTLKNAFVTTGKKIAKRRGLRALAGSLVGPSGEKTFGLHNINGALTVFSESAAAWSLPAPVQKLVTSAVADPGWTLADSVFGATYQSFAYFVGKYTNGAQVRYYHHLFDGAPSTQITTLPGTVVTTGSKAPGITVMASRVFVTSGDGRLVYYCAAGNARDWTTANDAGSLAVALQNNVATGAAALGNFQDKLAVMFSDSVQTWNIFVDPAQNAIDRRIYGVGSAAPYSLASFGNDLVFLSPSGFRSLSVASISDRIDDRDVGVPVDKLVVPDIAACLAQQSPPDAPGVAAVAIERFQSLWIPQLGQYWCWMPMATTTRVWAYTYSKLSKLACWSQFDFPFVMTGVAIAAGTVYVRSATKLYELTDEVYTDDGTLIDVEVQMAFQDAKTPGVQKQIYGADFVIEGTAEVAYKFDPRDQTKETVPQTITGDTRPGDMVPVEVVSPCIAPVFRQSADAPLEIDALTLYYNLLATV